MAVHRVAARSGVGLVILVSFLVSSGLWAQAQDDTFVFMSSQLACPAAGDNGNNCYLNSPLAATKAVAALRDAGVRTFLIPSATLSEMLILGQAVSAAGLKFYTYEHWEFRDAVRPGYPGGGFDCAYYTQHRIEAELLPLRQAFPNAFGGVQLTDEPLRRDFANLGAQVACLRADPRLAGLKIFVDLLPIYSNQMQPGGSAPTPGAMSPTQYGVSCAAGGIVNPVAAQAVVATYLDYVAAAADTIRPDYLATNIYVFDSLLAACPAGREFVMSEGLSAISNVARSRGQKPVAYLQNVRTAVPPYAFEPTGFHHHRWYASWFFVFGGRQFANFLSHDDDTIASVLHHGMLTPTNDSRDLAVEALSTHGFTQQLQQHLASRSYRGFVAPCLSVLTGDLVGWLPSAQVIAGEYGRSVDSSAMLFFARRDFSQPASTPIGLNKWWVKIERLNFGSGLWERVGTNTNAIQVSLVEFPGALYRLSMQ